MKGFERVRTMPYPSYTEGAPTCQEGRHVHDDNLGTHEPERRSVGMGAEDTLRVPAPDSAFWMRLHVQAWTMRLPYVFIVL